jgi:chromate transporter
MNIYLQLFFSFFKIGLFGFGGGYTILSLIQNEVIVHHWMTQAEFTDIVAISQMTPSPIGTCAATYVGYTASGGHVLGAAVALTAVILPSLIIMTAVCKFFLILKGNKYMEAALAGLRPTVIGLLASAVLFLLTKENFVDYKSVILCIAAFTASYQFKAHPILVIVIAGFMGLLLY